MSTHWRHSLRSSRPLPWGGAFLVACAIFACPTGALRAAEVYKYVDAQGHVIYSDQAVADTSSAAPPAAGTAGGTPAGEVHTNDAPPALPDYEQPPCPQEGYLWTPGYWAWGPAGYYWVPGVWVQPPRVGVLWTPAWWEFVGAVYLLHPGYWGSHMGYYGGVNYGFGYFGVGFSGGRWVGDAFAYNRSVSNVDERAFHHIYNEAVPNSARLNRVSYHGGPGGTTVTATAQERAFAAEPHIASTAFQRQNTLQAARQPVLLQRTYANPSASASSAVNHTVSSSSQPATSGAPGVAAHSIAAARAVAAPPAVPTPMVSRTPPPPPSARAPIPAATHPSTSTPARTMPIKSTPLTH
jgi:hypothetical protein